MWLSTVADMRRASATPSSATASARQHQSSMAISEVRIGLG